MWLLSKRVFKRDFILPLCRYMKCSPIEFPDITKTLEEKLKEESTYNPLLDFKVDIGLPPPPKISNKELKQRNQYLMQRKNDPDLEEKSRKLLLDPSLDEIRAEWEKSKGPQQIQAVADHYKIFDHLFGDAYFTPYVIMNVFYPQPCGKLAAPVCRGNVVKPTEALSAPEVIFESDPSDLWTLTLVSPDGHLTEDNMEYVHWFVGNIPGGDVKKGEIIWDYLPPFPPRGIGFQRFIFVLYKQDREINYSNLKKDLPRLELHDRSFKTLEFYRERQDFMTPAGLAFFQSDWDRTCKKIFHEVLNMDEPVFEYDHDPKFLRVQEWYPKKRPFDLYLDNYRDPKSISQEYLLKKLKNVHPFEPPQPPFPYPRALRYKYVNLPSWLRRKEIRFDSGIGRVQNDRTEEYE